ncbi:hypothetical protein RHGRI_029566 [Rhododendron griersonianum]|uniref:SET domain-containing protein n=1 Tax=Rhododendron griersonianum TaxID=479676 RepID=A0AAV6IKV6_9ERIC|nr:hypothetical protein RHGRI_029566 [Rhododendron griersonianum]
MTTTATTTATAFSIWASISLSKHHAIFQVYWQILKEDMALVYEDWKECILPLWASDSFELNPDFFGVEQYFAAKSLIASRSFEIDDYHGFGMVPLADLAKDAASYLEIPANLKLDSTIEESFKEDIKKEYKGSKNCAGEKQKELVHLHLPNHIKKYQLALKIERDNARYDCLRAKARALQYYHFRSLESVGSHYSGQPPDSVQVFSPPPPVPSLHRHILKTRRRGPRRATDGRLRLEMVSNSESLDLSFDTWGFFNTRGRRRDFQSRDQNYFEHKLKPEVLALVVRKPALAILAAAKTVQLRETPHSQVSGDGNGPGGGALGPLLSSEHTRLHCAQSVVPDDILFGGSSSGGVPTFASPPLSGDAPTPFTFPQGQLSDPSYFFLMSSLRFNHKTGAEDVHFTCIASQLIPESDEEDNLKNDVYEFVGNTEDNLLSEEYKNSGSGEQSTLNVLSTDGSSSVPSAFGDDPTVLEMIMVKDVKSGTEVFNTYGYVGNAALLHRYGFTEANNPYDIVNIDLELVVQWSSSLFSGRHSRMRLSLWRRLDYGGCVSQNSEYFEISLNGEPQVELLILLYIMLLPEEPYRQLDLTVSTAGSLNESLNLILPGHGNIETEEVPETIKDLLLTKSVRKALLAIANIRDSFYGSNSFEDDIEALRRSCPLRERKLYHSLMLRASERRILQKLRAYAAAAGAQLSGAVVRKKLKRT